MIEGQQLPEIVRGPITRATLALSAGASHDHLGIHIDSDYARAAGMDDVIVHGMLLMAYLAQGLRIWALPGRIVSWNVRFTAPTLVHAKIHCRGEVGDVFTSSGEPRARLLIGVWTDQLIQTVAGEAVIAFD
jgi:acyl dehydratase